MGMPRASRWPFQSGTASREMALASQMRREPGQGGCGDFLPEFHGVDGIVAGILSAVGNGRVVGAKRELLGSPLR